ncbi:hypothetical protein CBL_05406 [Carabus blaptoides fortunei]
MDLCYDRWAVIYDGASVKVLERSDAFCSPGKVHMPHTRIAFANTNIKLLARSVKERFSLPTSPHSIPGMFIKLHARGWHEVERQRVRRKYFSSGSARGSLD